MTCALGVRGMQRELRFIETMTTPSRKEDLLRKWPDFADSAEYLLPCLYMELFQNARPDGKVGIGETAHARLIQELFERKCAIVELDGGELQRILSVLAIRLTRLSDGRELSVLASQDPRMGFPRRCRLPGTTRRRGQEPIDCLDDFVGKRLAPFDEGICLLGVEAASSEVKLSHTFQIATKYISSVFRANVHPDFPDPHLPIIVPGHKAPLGINQDVFATHHDGHIWLYTWLRGSERDFLCSHEGAEVLEHWVGPTDLVDFQNNLPDDQRVIQRVI